MKQRKRKNICRLLIVGGALLCFACIAYWISTVDAPALDTAIRQQVYGLRSGLLNTVFIPITYMGNWQTITVLALVLLLLPGTRREIGVPFAVISIASTAVYKLVKEIFHRPRPELAVRLIEQGGYSFPSGHSMNCIVCYGILIYLIRRYCTNRRVADCLTVLLGLLIFLIGFSRIYVGVHFPTDVLGGWSLGLAFLLTCIMILERIKGDRNDLSLHNRNYR